MNEKQVKSKTIHKHDIEANWQKSSLVPNRGQLIIYDIDAIHSHERLKIGDGINNVNDLAFAMDIDHTALHSMLEEVLAL